MHVVGLQGRLPDARDSSTPPSASSSAGCTTSTGSTRWSPRSASPAPSTARWSLSARPQGGGPRGGAGGGGQARAFVRRHGRAPSSTPVPRCRWRARTPQLVQARVRGTARSSFTVAHHGRVLATVVYEGTVFQGTVSTCFRPGGRQPGRGGVDRALRGGHHVSRLCVVRLHRGRRGHAVGDRVQSAGHERRALPRTVALAHAMLPATDGEARRPCRTARSGSSSSSTPRSRKRSGRCSPAAPSGDKLQQLVSAQRRDLVARVIPGRSCS